MPRTPKQYFRFALTKLGLFDETAFRLVMDEIRADDTFLVSFPKSGNTWVRFLVANLLHPGKEIHFGNIDEYVPDVYSAIDRVNSMKSPRLIKTHHPEFNSFPKSLYFVRDYRDVLISYYHYHISLKEFSGTFAEYIRTVNTLHPFGEWNAHVLGAYAFQKENPERMIIVRYEDLILDPVRELKRIGKFLGCAENAPYEEITERCRFEQLKQAEKKHGSEFLKLSGEHFFREGKSGKWKQHFSADELAFVLQNEKTKTALLTAGYSLS